MNNFREKDIVLLLGAGCSKDAGIPTSGDMIEDLERMFDLPGEWKTYKALYNFLKSSILFADGLRGSFSPDSLNIERLMNTINELVKKEEHPIYPFIGAWNSKIIELCGNDFDSLKKFKTLIMEKLKSWVTLGDYNEAGYYNKFGGLSQALTFPVSIFSLNYDLCLEKNVIGVDINVERGFDSNDRKWKWQRFDRTDESNVNIYLYKMHGSIDWARGDDGFLTYYDEILRIEEPDLIFGTNYKLQYIDPYLFFAYEFRRYCLGTRLIVTLGYGFGDEHINGMMRQALKSDTERVLLSVIYNPSKNETELMEEIVKRMGLKEGELSPGQIAVRNVTAKDFILNEMQPDDLGRFLPSPHDPFNEGGFAAGELH